MKTINKTKAFTLLEILLVIALAIGIFAISAPLGLRMYRTQLVEDTTSNIIDALERARHYAILQKYDSSFGVTLSEVSDSYVLFAGPDYANRDQTKDEVYPVISQITFSGLTDIVFASLTGTSSTTGTIIISYGDDIVREILIDNSGLIYKRTPPWWELDDSLVGFWTSVKSGSISALGTWLDYSGNDNDGLLAGNAYVDSDGLQLDGSGDYMETTFNDINWSEFSFSVWAKMNIHSGTERGGILEFNNKTWLFEQHWTQDIRFYLGNFVTTATIPSSNFDSDVWYHFIGIYDGSKAKVYLNGVLGGTSSEYDLSFGGNYLFSIGKSNFFNGSIDDILLYNRALTSDEIAEIFNGQKAKYGY